MNSSQAKEERLQELKQEDNKIKEGNRVDL